VRTRTAGRAEAALLTAAALVLVACGDDGTAADAERAIRGDRCIVRLHGKGGEGAAPRTSGNGVIELAPAGNGEGWGGREWRYSTDEDYEVALAAVRAAIDDAGCASSIVVNGFSNGASFAAAVYCRGETFDGRLTGVVIDDPVADAATKGCAPAPHVPAVLYWTGALDRTAPPGTDCEPIDWTCAGGTVVGAEAFARSAGLVVSPSPFTEHEWYHDAPEIARWSS
jgi:hypothetical protein